MWLLASLSPSHVYVHQGNISATTETPHKIRPSQQLFYELLNHIRGKAFIKRLLLPSANGRGIGRRPYLLCRIGSPKVAPRMRYDKPALLQSDLTNLE